MLVTLWVISPILVPRQLLPADVAVGYKIVRLSERSSLFIFFIGVLIPYLARVPRGIDWLADYLDGGFVGFVMLQVFNSIAWGAIIVVGLAFRRKALIWLPAIAGFSYLFYRHNTLDLRSDAQSSLALIFIPIYALLPVVGGAALALLIDLLKRSSR